MFHLLRGGSSAVTAFFLKLMLKTPASVRAEIPLFLAFEFFCTIHSTPEAPNSYGNNQNTNILSLIKNTALPKSTRNPSMTGRVHFASVCTYFYVTELMGAFIKFSLMELKQTPGFPSCSITKATYYLLYQGWQGGPQQSLTQHLLRRKCLSAPGFLHP